MGKEISSRIYYAASTVPRAAKVRLFWRAVKASMAPLEAHRRRNIRDHHCRITPNPNNKPAKAFLAFRSHTYATTSCVGYMLRHRGPCPPQLLGPSALSNLPADAHPLAQDFGLTSVYPADSTLICPQAEMNAVRGLGKFNTGMFFQRKFSGIRHGRTANCPTCLIVD